MDDFEGEELNVHLPPPTPWPLVLGLGIALMMAGLVVFVRPPIETGELVFPLGGAVCFFFALFMMLRDDVKASQHGAEHH